MIQLLRFFLLFLVLQFAASALAQPSVPTGEARAWCHLCPWNALNNLSHSRRDFPLGLGMETQPGLAPRSEVQYQRDYIYECLSAASAGLDAFALDIIVSQPLENWLFGVDGYLKAAETVSEETGRPFYAAPCLDNPGSRRPEDLADYIETLLSERANSPAWPKLEGRPVIWTFAGTNMPAEDWRVLLALLAERKLSPVFILDANSLYAQVQPATSPGNQWAGLPVAELDALANLPVALYAFRTDFDQRTRERCDAYLQARHPDSLAARLSIGTLWPGYWSLGSGWYVDPQGTGVIRDTFAQAAEARWLTVTTWNDFFETTHFQPSLGFGTGRLDLLHALLSGWRGDNLWPPEPRLYLWQPNELQVGEAVKGEVLALLPEGSSQVQARVSLCDITGKPTRLGEWTDFAKSAITAVPYDLGSVEAAAGSCQYLLLEYQLPGAMSQACISQPIYIWPAGYHPLATRRGTLWQAGAQQRGPQRVTLDETEGVLKRIEVAWDEGELPAGSRLYVRQNFNLIHFPGETASPVLYDMEATYGEGRAPWEVYPPVPKAQRWGFFDTVVVLPDGSLRWSEPLWVPPSGDADLQCAGLWHLDEGDGQRATDASPYSHEGSLSGGVSWQLPGRLGAACLHFDGIDASLEIPGGRFPQGDFTVSAWLKLDIPRLVAQQCLYVDINGCILFAVDEAGHLTCSRATEEGWAAVSCATPLPEGEWTHIAVTYDQRFLRLYVNGVADGQAPCTGTRASNVTAMGCNPFGARGCYLAGSLDEVKVTARVASPEELRTEATH